MANFYILLATLSPLLGSLIAFLLRRQSIALIGFVCSLSLVLFAFTATAYRMAFGWLPGVEMGLQVDHISLMIHTVVALVAALVAVFSRYYMKGARWPFRYWIYLGAFTTAMQGLVFSPNLLQLFVFWELVGFCSFLLIGYYQTDKAALAARKAFWINRLGDAGLLAGIVIIWTSTGSLSFSAIAQAPDWVPYLLFMGVLAKSAQFPLQVWLPDAMAGPTTASALIHAATMVAAGVYLLARIVPFVGAEPLHFLLVIGVITALLAAFSALAQRDIKRLLAFSTVSQLGFMVAAMGTGEWQAGLFHLTTHAFFKAGLFLGAGVLIHEMAGHTENPQNLYQMGGLRKKLPVTAACMTVCGLALAGFPLTSGALSKESILAAISQQNIEYGMLMLVATVLTALYVGKLLWLAFFRPAPSPDVSDRGIAVRLPLLVLAGGAIWLVFSFNGWLSNYLNWEPVHSVATLVYANVAWVTGILLAIVAFRYRIWKVLEGKLNVSWQSKPYEWLATGLVMLANRLALFDRFIVDGAVNLSARVVGGGDFNKMMNRTVKAKPLHYFRPPVGPLHLSALAAWIDSRLVDGLVNAVGNAMLWLGRRMRDSQTGAVQSYLLYTLIFLILLLVLLLL